MGRARGLLDRIFPIAPDQAPNEMGALSRLAARLAAASIIVTAIMVYLGVKDAAIDRMLREEPEAVLFFCGLIATGTVFALIAQQASAAKRYPPWYAWLPATALALAFPILSAYFRTHLAVSRPANWIVVDAAIVMIALLIAGVLLQGKRVSLILCLLTFGGTAFALGTYGVTRLAVDSKTLVASTAIVSPSVARKEDGLLHLSATITATDVLDCYAVVAEAGQIELARARGGGDGRVELALDAPVVPAMRGGRPEVVELRAQLKADRGSACEELGAGLESSATVPIVSAQAAPLIAAEWLDANTLKISVSSPNVSDPRTATVQVLIKSHRLCETVAYAVVPVRQGGDLASTIQINVPKEAEEIEVRSTFLVAPVTEIPARSACLVDGSQVQSAVLFRRPIIDP